jgi:hypothetical protein
MAKLVQIRIKQTDYDHLRAGQYNLCFARKTNGDYTVLCQSISNFFPSTRFSWQPDYKLFGTNYFTAGAAVVVETDMVDVSRVTTSAAVMDAGGVMRPPSSSVRAIPLVNNYGPIHIGLFASSAGPDDEQQSLPIYLSPQPVAGTGAALVPVDVVRVWFQQNTVSSTMLSPEMLAASPDAIEVDLTASDTATVQYANSVWSLTAGG